LIELYYYINWKGPGEFKHSSTDDPIIGYSPDETMLFYND
jgi:hypothetical protein